MDSVVQNGWDQLRCFLSPYHPGVQDPDSRYLNLTRLTVQYTDLAALSEGHTLHVQPALRPDPSTRSSVALLRLHIDLQLRAPPILVTT